MTYKELLTKIQMYLNMPTKKPKCFKDDNFLYCFCGKCKPDDYPLPKDFSNLVATNAVEHYKKLERID